MKSNDSKTPKGSQNPLITVNNLDSELRISKYAKSMKVQNNNISYE